MKQYQFYGHDTKEVHPIEDKYTISNQREMYDALYEIWCEYSCAPRLRNSWSKDNVTCGQCSITAFLVQDIFGGEVRGILRPGGNYHCYNVIKDVLFDLTSEQFKDEVLDYTNNPIQQRSDHFSKKEKEERYEYLKTQFINKFSK